MAGDRVRGGGGGARDATMNCSFSATCKQKKVRNGVEMGDEKEGQTCY